jgi:hypothetical protein
MWTEESFSAVPELYAKLQDIRDENMRHSQYVTAMENLKHIFTVPESVEKTKQWINDGKLLHAHQVQWKLPPFNFRFVVRLLDWLVTGRTRKHLGLYCI